MGSKKTTDTSQTQTERTAFNPAGLATYEGLQPQLGGFYGQYLNGPLQGTPGYQEGLRAASEAAGQLGARGVSNVSQNLLASGYGGRIAPAFQQELLQRAGYNTSALQSSAFLQNYLNQLGIRNQIAGLASGYRPLQTGGTQTGQLHSVEKTGGLGTFLPQIAGAAIGGLAGGFGGGGFSLGNFFRGAAGQPGGPSGNAFFSSPFGQFEQQAAGPAPYYQSPYSSPGLVFPVNGTP